MYDCKYISDDGVLTFAWNLRLSSLAHVKLKFNIYIYEFAQ